MPGKGTTSVSSLVFRPISWFPMRFPLLTATVFMGMLFFWSIDGPAIRNSIRAWRNRREYSALKLQSLDNLPQYALYSPVNVIENHQNLTQRSFHGDVNPTHLNSSFHGDVNPTHLNSSHGDVNLSHLNSSHGDVNLSHLNSSHGDVNLSHHNSSQLSPLSSENVLRSDPDSSRNATLSARKDNGNKKRAPRMVHHDWISATLEPDFTSNLLSRWLAPGGEDCRYSVTEEIRIPGLDERNPVELSAGEIYRFVIHAVDGKGNPRCLGGDYFETDLSGELWKSRPPIGDLGNGSYSFSFQVHPDFSGEYNLTIILLFRHFEGLRFSPERFVYQRELRRFPIRFLKSNAQLPSLRICEKPDFTKDVWSGRWTRLAKKDDCNISNDGRYRCLEPEFSCQKPWCEGSLGSLESNGWVYSSHCAFRIFSTELAWECLQNRWIFFWGDSNHVDTIRNLLNFVLDLPEIKSVPRRFDTNFSNPRNNTQTIRITSIFNGHWIETKNYQGLDSLQNEGFRDVLKNFFSSEETVPDTVILNSGLHDGVHFKNIRQFAEAAERAATFWKGVLELVSKRGKRVPELLFRSTIATGGYARRLMFNPNKMDAFNGVLLDNLRRVGIVSGVIDDFDMTYPWHYDNRCNDGVHYGRSPAKAKWTDGEIGHQYFVDLMLGHVILNALCAR
ncbi:uncharacterized protein LOC122091075 [Macadamia integrifolia]|uniref:uncharacterized protein LOC122091075 n=1 Tax=Macadamia integrifolia TaxID=60698 RepID=UPI001C4E956F|nr:uncharacterized protein LOC122091075 [Macadamia integrifolia]